MTSRLTVMYEYISEDGYRYTLDLKSEVRIPEIYRCNLYYFPSFRLDVKLVTVAVHVMTAALFTFDHLAADRHV
jgi:hypothetical protein